MPLINKDAIDALERLMSRRGLQISVWLFVMAGLFVLVAFGIGKLVPPQIVSPETRVVVESVRPEPKMEATSKFNYTEAGASLEVVKNAWLRQDDGTYVVRPWINVVSKFQRSGLVLNFKSSGIDRITEIVPFNRQPTIHGPLKKSEHSYSHYIQRPWGSYIISLHMFEASDVQFSYRFEGEEESKSVTWKAPKP